VHVIGAGMDTKVPIEYEEGH